jgi:hypothetical protein
MLKRIAIFGIAFGCAFGIVAALGLTALRRYSVRPRPWDSKSITCTSAQAVPTYELNPETNTMKLDGFSLSFALANNTGRDYTVPQNIKVYRRDPGSKALADFRGKIEHAVLVPAHDRAELSVQLDYGCSNIDMSGHETERNAETCFHDAFADAVAFVALDEEKKIWVNLTKPTLSAPKEEKNHSEAKPARLGSPQKGNVFDRIASSDEADRLVSLCTQQHFQPPKDSFAAHGGYADILADLPQPPRGYKLDASPSTCEIALEWQNYCRDKVK